MEIKSLSISFRLRRLRTETAHVSVRVTDEMWRTNEKGPDRKLDVDKIVEAALAMGRFDSITWEPDGEAEISLHPLQTPPDRGTGTVQ